LTSIYSIAISQEKESLDSHWQLLTEEERNRADRFVRLRDRIVFVVTRAQLRKILAKHLDKDPSTLTLAYGETGKPFVDGESLRFNASHSNDLSLIAINESSEIGVDLEYKREVLNLDALAQRFFASTEYSEYSNSEDKSGSFFSIWTMKEAIIKLSGKGLAAGLGNFEVSQSAQELGHLVSCQLEDLSSKVVYLLPLSIETGYCAAFAADITDNPNDFSHEIIPWSPVLA